MIRAILMGGLVLTSSTALASPLLSLNKHDSVFEQGRFSYDYIEAGYLTGEEDDSVGGASLDIESAASDFVLSGSLTSHVFLRGRYTNTEYEVLEENSNSGEVFDYEASSSYGDLMIGLHVPVIEAGLNLDLIAMAGFFRESFERDETAFAVLPWLNYTGEFALPDRDYTRSGAVYEVGARTDFGLSFLDASAGYFYIDTKDGSYYQSGPRFTLGVQVWHGLQLGGQYVGRSDEVLDNTTDLSHVGGYIRYVF